MLGKLLALFILVPIIELILLIEIGKVIGTLNTVLLVIFTGVAGATLAKLEGSRVWQQTQKELADFQVPADRLIDGLLILIGGILLLTPGVLTDVLGLALIIPISRQPFKRAVKKQFEARTSRQRTKVEVFSVDSNQNISSSENTVVKDS